jgi:phosphate/sulfate permease
MCQPPIHFTFAHSIYFLGYALQTMAAWISYMWSFGFPLSLSQSLLLLLALPFAMRASYVHMVDFK